MEGNVTEGVLKLERDEKGRRDETLAVLSLLPTSLPPFLPGCLSACPLALARRRRRWCTVASRLVNSVSCLAMPQVCGPQGPGHSHLEKNNSGPCHLHRRRAEGQRGKFNFTVFFLLHIISNLHCDKNYHQGMSMSFFPLMIHSF